MFLETRWFKNHILFYAYVHYFWSLDQLVLRSRIRSYVHTYVLTCATLFLGNRSILFSENLQLVRACRCKKNVSSAWVKKWPKNFLGSKIISLILPKNHSLITQKLFWPFFGVFSGFLGVPQNYIIWLFKSVFWQFLCQKNGRTSRDPASRLVSDWFIGIVWLLELKSI